MLRVAGAKKSTLESSWRGKSTIRWTVCFSSTKERRNASRSRLVTDLEKKRRWKKELSRTGLNGRNRTKSIWRSSTITSKNSESQYWKSRQKPRMRLKKRVARVWRKQQNFSTIIGAGKIYMLRKLGEVLLRRRVCGFCQSHRCRRQLLLTCWFRTKTIKILHNSFTCSRKNLSKNYTNESNQQYPTKASTT